MYVCVYVFRGTGFEIIYGNKLLSKMRVGGKGEGGPVPSSQTTILLFTSHKTNRSQPHVWVISARL